jgi:hypothetical protein
MSKVLSSISRRDVLVGAASARVSLLGAKAFGLSGQRKPEDAARFRFAHLTDLQIKGQRCAHQVQAAIEHAIDQPHKPELILTGGDLVYDSMTADERFVRHQWRDVKLVFSQRRLPTDHILC